MEPDPYLFDIPHMAIPIDELEDLDPLSDDQETITDSSTDDLLKDFKPSTREQILKIQRTLSSDDIRVAIKEYRRKRDVNNIAAKKSRSKKLVTVRQVNMTRKLIATRLRSKFKTVAEAVEFIKMIHDQLE